TPIAIRGPYEIIPAVLFAPLFQAGLQDLFIQALIKSFPWIIGVETLSQASVNKLVISFNNQPVSFYRNSSFIDEDEDADNELGNRTLPTTPIPIEVAICIDLL